ncbi:hypothetical protein [Bacillus solimangrovi]|uniref:Uncharacterized protein n=1 Tax=Bacillus solimangrovi TaxID=1305675 RepID=A0A1E5LEB1_9BACI|nr:hypothetical protein [Bacillus solimangrovi]OEH92423.1 hypothetical protein BFG57_16065 [Bacillus solimangrovi]
MNKKFLIPAGAFIILGILFLFFNIHSLNIQLIVLGISFIFFYVIVQGPQQEENFVWLFIGLLLIAFGFYFTLQNFPIFTHPGVLFIVIAIVFLGLLGHTLQIRSSSPHVLFWPAYCSTIFIIIALSTFFTFALWAALLIFIGIMILMLQN